MDKTRPCGFKTPNRLRCGNRGKCAQVFLGHNHVGAFLYHCGFPVRPLIGVRAFADERAV